MAKRIFLESRNVNVPVVGYPSGYGHLYLVYRDQGAATNNTDRVIAGETNYLIGPIPLNTLLCVFAGVEIRETTGDDYNGATAQSRFSLDITDRATSTRMASPMPVSCR